MRFTSASGLATWCRDQMAVRYQQAVHINEGAPNEEAPLNEVVDEGDEQVFACDLPLMDEAHAEDAMNTLSDANVLGQALMLHDDEDGEQPSWAEHHICHHESEPGRPCEVVRREVSP